jgi:hypothetical protein
MHPEVNSDTEPSYSEVNSSVHLNPVTFNLAMLAMKVPDSDAARGRAIGIDAKWVRSALDGNPVGGKFIGNTITVFRRHRLKLERLGLKVEMDTFFNVPETVGVGVPDGK